MTNISKSFLTRCFNLDEPLLAIRPHWLEMFLPLLLISLGTGSFLGILFLIIAPLFPTFHLTALLTLLILLLAGLAGAMVIGKWFFHGYIVTTGRILEFHCLPLLSHMTNGILLNQVRCTEIDVSKNGLLQHLFDIGTVTITFDRPTRQEQFILSHVVHPEEVGNRLGEILDTKETAPTQSLRWVRDPLNTHSLVFSQDIYPSIG